MSFAPPGFAHSSARLAHALRRAILCSGGLSSNSSACTSGSTSSTSSGVYRSHHGAGGSIGWCGSVKLTQPKNGPSTPREPLARAVGDPRGGVILFGQRVAPRLRVVPLRARRFGLHQPQALDAALGAVAEQVARVVQAERRRAVDPVPPAHQVGDPQVVAEQHELDVLEAEVRAVPLRVDVRRALDRFDLARRQERERRREVRLAEERGAVARRRRAASRPNAPRRRPAGRCRCT